MDLDAHSYRLAEEAGRKIHQLLSSDAELAKGVANWGSVHKPSRRFTQLLARSPAPRACDVVALRRGGAGRGAAQVLLRSDVCSQVDVYGQPGVPLQWYRSSGLGHITVAPGSTPGELDLAKTLVQERFFLRAAMHDGKLCFFK